MATVEELTLIGLAKAYALDGKAAEYRPPAGTPAPVTVLVSRGTGDEADGADALGRMARIRVRSAESGEVAARGVFALDPNPPGEELWEVLWAGKSADGLEWIAQTARR